MCSMWPAIPVTPSRYTRDPSGLRVPQDDVGLES